MVAGWYPDPSENVQRYWDGVAWTDHTAPAGVPAPGAARVGRNGLAIAALLLGITSLIINSYFIPSVLAVIFGAIAVARGRVNLPVAIVGLALGIVGLVLTAFILSAPDFASS